MSFKKSLRSKDFVVTAELPLTPASTRDTLLAAAALLVRIDPTNEKK